MPVSINKGRLKSSAGSIGASFGFIIWGAVILFLNSFPSINSSDEWAVFGYSMISIAAIVLFANVIYVLTHIADHE